MTVIDRLTPDATPLLDGVAPLDVIGLDRTIAQRGAVKSGAAENNPNTGLKDQVGWEIRVWQPIHAVRRRA